MLIITVILIMMIIIKNINDNDSDGDYDNTDKFEKNEVVLEVCIVSFIMSQLLFALLL